MGTNALPFLIETLERKPSKLAEAADKQRAAHPESIPEIINKILPAAYPVEIRRDTAAFLLGELGPLAEAAIPTLFRICCDTNENDRVQGQAWRALAKMGEKGAVLVPDYLRWLKGNDPELQETGAAFLGTVGPKARVAMPELLKAADGTNKSLARAAALALWSIDRRTNVALRILTRGLQSTNSTWRQIALIDLRKMGPAAAEAAPQIEPFLRDPDDLIRVHAEQALAEIAPDLLVSSQQRMNQDSEAQIAKLIEMMREGEYPKRYRAVEAIGVFGPAAKAAVPALVEALEGFVPATGFLASTSKRNSQMVVQKRWQKSARSPFCRPRTYRTAARKFRLRAVVLQSPRPNWTRRSRGSSRFREPSAGRAPRDPLRRRRSPDSDRADPMFERRNSSEDTPT